MAKARHKIEYVTKAGKHGTLYLYAIKYTDKTDPTGFGTDTVRLWAYDAEHAEERFFEEDEDPDWKIVSGPTRVREK